jgi:hypothetical protein
VVDELTDELDKRGVKNRAINLMLRADIASDQVIDALGRLGLVRCLLGVESTNEQGLRALGRNSSPEVNLTAMKNLGKRGVMFHFNILLIHPESTIDSIDREIQGLSEVTGGLIDPFQVEVFQGTQLFNRLAREGRLLGGPLLYHYWPEEPMARRFAEIFLRLKRDAFGFLHLTAFAYEVLGAFAVARKLALIARQNAWLGRKAAELIDEHNVLWVDLLKRASVLSRASAGSAQVDQFIEQTQIRAALLTISFNDFKKTLEKTAIQPLTSDIFYPRTAAAVAVAVALLGPQGCAKETNVAHKTDTGIVSHDDASVDGGLIKDAGSGKDSNIAKGDSGRDANPTADKDSSAEASPYADAYICNETTARQEGNAMIDSVYNPCLKGLEPGLSCIGTSSSSDYWHGAITARFVLDEKGKVTDIQGNGSDRDFLTPELKACYLKALEGQTFPCLAEKNQYWIKCGVLLA